MTKQDQLEIFRKNYPSVRVTVYEGFMVYKVGRDHVKASLSQSTKLISYLELNLTAKATGVDTFVIE